MEEKLKTADKFVEFIKGRPEATLRDAADTTGISYRQLQRIIGPLVKSGVVRESGVGQRGQKVYVAGRVEKNENGKHDVQYMSKGSV